MNEPKGKLVFDHVEDKVSTHAIYVDIFYRDENGVLWKFHTASFKYGMEKVEEKIS